MVISEKSSQGLNLLQALRAEKNQRFVSEKVLG